MIQDVTQILGMKTLKLSDNNMQVIIFKNMNNKKKHINHLRKITARIKLLMRKLTTIQERITRHSVMIKLIRMTIILSILMIKTNMVKNTLLIETDSYLLTRPKVIKFKRPTHTKSSRITQMETKGRNKFKNLINFNTRRNLLRSKCANKRPKIKNF